MTYVKPSLIIIQDLQFTPSAVMDSLRPWICGPNAILHRYGVSNEKETTILSYYDYLNDTTYEYPNRSAGSLIDTTYSALNVESANLCYYENLENSVSEDPDITADVTTQNLIHSKTLSFVTNGSNVRSGVFGDRDVQIGDTVWLRSRTQQESGGCKDTGFTTKVLGFVSNASGTSIGPVENTTDYDQAEDSLVVTSNNTMSVYNASNPDDPITNNLELTLTGTYNGLKAGKMLETYRIYVTRVINTPGCSEVLVNILSGSGTDTQRDVSITAGGVFDIGTRGVKGSISAADYEKLLVTMEWLVTATSAYTAPTMVAGGTYKHTADDTYIVRCTQGGTLGAVTDYAVLSLQSTQGTVFQANIKAPAVGVPQNIGGYGVTITFTGSDKLVAGETYTFDVVGSASGPVQSILLQKNLPVELLVPGQGLDIRLSVLRDIEVPEQSEVINGFYNFIQDLDELAVSAGIQVYNTEFTANGAPIALKMLGGDMFFTYREWTPVLADNVYTINSLNEITSTNVIPGALDIDNPLKWGIYKAYQNAAGSDIKFTAVADPDNVQDWADALVRIEGRRDVYTLVPLTFNRAIQDLVVAAVEQDSSESACAWKHALFSSKIDDILPVTDATVNVLGQFVKENESSPRANLFTATDSSAFITVGVKPGDILRFNYGVDSFGNSTYDSYTVNKVLTETTLLVLNGPMEETTVNLKYEVWHSATRQEQAERIASISRSFSNRRVCHVWPDKAYSAGVEQAGYFVCAAIGGLMGGAAPHQPLTRVELRGIDAVTRSEGYFSESQLNLIADAGTWVVSDAGGGLIYTRHALTTDRTDVLTQEEMITRDMDSVSLYFYQILDPFVGKTNTVPETITQIRDLMIIVLDSFVTNTTEGLGGQITDWEDLVVERNSILKDQIDIGVLVEPPIPSNRIRLALRVGIIEDTSSE